MPEIAYKHPSKPSARPRTRRRFLVLAVVILLLIVGWRLLQKDTTPQAAQPAAEQSNSELTDGSSESTTPRRLKTFTGAEFVSLYNSFAYPNVREFDISPLITGNAAADERIRTLAIARGYIGRSVAIPPLVDAGTYQLQERAKSSWDALVAAARTAGHRLTMTAGFRTIEDQRELFTEALYATGATPSSIAAGSSDAAVTNVLKRISVPGYTRHHSGYTVDIGCESDSGKVFAASACFAWLSRNNYEQAKTYGWIPSYPEGAPNQGPDPESWEYSWVGYEAVSEPVL